MKLRFSVLRIEIEINLNICVDLNVNYVPSTFNPDDDNNQEKKNATFSSHHDDDDNAENFSFDLEAFNFHSGHVDYFPMVLCHHECVVILKRRKKYPPPLPPKNYNNNNNNPSRVCTCKTHQSRGVTSRELHHIYM